MKKLLRVFIALMIIVTTAFYTTRGQAEIKAEERVISSIVMVDTLEALRKQIDERMVEHPEKVLILFDLDDTVLDFPYMLGSKAWRDYIRKATKKIDQDVNWFDKLSYLLVTKYPIRTMEPNTAGFIKELQEKGFVVCGLTTRERNKWYDTPQLGVDQLTIEQLQSVGIHFSDNLLKSAYSDLAKNSEYFEGVFFADTDLKGDYLIKLFDGVTNRSDFPSYIIFIDDKLNQVNSVAQVLTENFEVDNLCVHYIATEARAKLFNPLIADIQMWAFVTSDNRMILSDEQADAIAKATPTFDAQYYLESALENVRHKK